MKFYTAEINGIQEILVAFADDGAAYRLNMLQKLSGRLAYREKKKWRSYSSWEKILTLCRERW